MFDVYEIFYKKDNIMKKILLTVIAISIYLNANFTTNTNGVVTDTTTLLQWQDSYSDNKDFVKKAYWTEAIDYCEELVLEGKDDWRLPNIKELQSLIDNTKLHFSVNRAFKRKKSNLYWSSTTYKKIYTNAWRVNFANGSTSKGRKKNNSFVRCVRAN